MHGLKTDSSNIFTHALDGRSRRGKGGRVRTVPVPCWVKAAVDEWLAVARIETV